MIGRTQDLIVTFVLPALTPLTVPLASTVGDLRVLDRVGNGRRSLLGRDGRVHACGFADLDRYCGCLDRFGERVGIALGEARHSVEVNLESEVRLGVWIAALRIDVRDGDDAFKRLTVWGDPT